jgi:hypothetical protein
MAFCLGRVVGAGSSALLFWVFTLKEGRQMSIMFFLLYRKEPGFRFVTVMAGATYGSLEVCCFVHLSAYFFAISSRIVAFFSLSSVRDTEVSLFEERSLIEDNESFLYLGFRGEGQSN